MGLQVNHDMRRSILVDVLTVYGQGGKSIVFCERKRDADEVAAGVALAMPCEVSCPALSTAALLLDAVHYGGSHLQGAIPEFFWDGADPEYHGLSVPPEPSKTRGLQQ